MNLQAAKILDEAIQNQGRHEITAAAEGFRKARTLLYISGLKGHGNDAVFIELSQKVDNGFESTSHREKGLIKS